MTLSETLAEIEAFWKSPAYGDPKLYERLFAQDEENPSEVITRLVSALRYAINEVDLVTTARWPRGPRAKLDVVEARIAAILRGAKP